MDHMEEGLLRLTAPNPSPLTYRGTNTYVIGLQDVAVLDPGPDLAEHREAILTAISGRRVSHILITHAHLDHSEGAAKLADATGAPMLAFGTWDTGLSDVMTRLKGGLGGGEGRDTAFIPDTILSDSDEITVSGKMLEAIHTPGHMGCHLSFSWGDAIFSGDLVMGWATSLVSPPDGDLTQFLASCERLARKESRVLYPGHGDPIRDPSARIAELVTHRHNRTEQIRAALRSGGGTPADLTRRVYTDVAPHLWPAAERNVLAHLIALVETGEADPGETLSATGHFTATATT